MTDGDMEVKWLNEMSSINMNFKFSKAIRDCLIFIINIGSKERDSWFSL